MQLSFGQTRQVGTWDQGPITGALPLCETPAWASTGSGYLEHPSPACPCLRLGRCQLREQSRDGLGRMRSMGTDGGSRVGQDDCGGLRNWGPGCASCPPGKVGSLVWPAPTPGPSSHLSHRIALAPGTPSNLCSPAPSSAPSQLPPCSLAYGWCNSR